jgi:ketosteroid isomerase-like protein
MLNFADYERVFNSGDDAALIDRFYADDLVFTGGTREYHGKDGLRAFLAWAHDGVREVMRPQKVLQDEHSILAEIDMDFHATRHRPDFPFAELHPGDSITVKFLVAYETRDDKVVSLKSMTWPAEKGVTKLPKLGAHPSQAAAFRAYTSAFSNADFDRFSSFYTDDVVLELGSVPRIEGKDGIVGFYRPMFARVRETLFPHSILTGDDHIAMDATSRFTAIEDAPDFVVGPLKQGEYIDVRVFVHYELRNGLISHIRVGRGGAPTAYFEDGTIRL